jgi:hypothetical protein
MAHFAQISSENKVLRVLVVPNDQEHRGQDFLANDLKLGGTWIKTSYNTLRGKHRLNGTPFRKNFAGVGYSYDPNRDAFIPPRPPDKVTDTGTFIYDFVEEECNWRPRFVPKTIS